VPTSRQLRVLPPIAATIAPLVLLGCATPQPLVRLTPASQPVVWVAGRATLMAEKDGVRVAAAFEHQDGSLLGLRVEVQNQTDDPLLIDPAEISFATCTGAEPSSCRPPKAVINPERMLAALDVKRSVEVADAANDETANGALVILSAMTLDSRQITSSVAAAEASAAHHETSQMNTSAQQRMWADAALRRNTVFPGHGVGGRVFLPIHLDARYVSLHVFAGEEDFTFRFTQTVVPVATGAPGAVGRK